MLMQAKRLLTFLSALILSNFNNYGQSVPNPTDTSYVMALLKKGEAIEQKQTDSALVYYRKAHDLAKKIGYKKGYFDGIRHLAYTLTDVGRPREARAIAQAGLTLARQDTSAMNLAICCFSLATAAYQEGNFKEAIHQFGETARYVRQMKDYSRLWSIHSNMALIYKGQKLYPQALEQFNRALSIQRSAKSPKMYLAMTYFNMADVYHLMDDTKTAKAYYQKTRLNIDPKEDYDLLAKLTNNLGEIFYEEAKYDSSFSYHTVALQLSRQLKNPLLELHQLIALARLHKQFGRYEKAANLLNRALVLANQSDEDPTERREIYEQYALLSQARGDYKSAYNWLTKYEAIEDTLDNQETKNLLQDYELKLRQAEARQKIAEKQRQISQLEAERKRQNLRLLIAVLVAGVVAVGAGFGYLYYRQRQRTAANALLAAERERELAVVQSELQGQQKERLRISKEMHDDLGASLTAIGLLSEVVKTRMGAQTTPEVEKISSISAEMVTAMNEIIWSLNTKNDSLNGLIAYTRSYASEFIDNTNLTLRTDVEESPQEIPMRGTDRRNVFLTVKEALNNVVKHAQATQVTLRIQPQTDQLVVDVCDNGHGFTPNGQASLRNGLGNMQARMTESGGHCEILPSPTGTCVKISYPYPAVATGKIRQM